MILETRSGAELSLPDCDEHLAQQFGVALQAARALQDNTVDTFIDAALVLLKDAAERQAQDELAEPAEHPIMAVLNKIAEHTGADRVMQGEGPNARSRIYLPKEKA